MAAKEPKPTKQLKQLLQEQQEPFMLDLYLFEKGYFRKSFNSTSGSTCCNGNSNKEKSLIRKKGVPQCSSVFTVVYNRVMSISDRLKIRSSFRRNGNVNVEENKNRFSNCNHQEAAEIDRFSSASSSTMFNSCSGSDAEETSTSQRKDQNFFKPNNKRLCNLTEGEVVTDRNNNSWQCMVERRQLSPVSVLEDASSLHYNERRREYFSSTVKSSCALLPNKVTEESILSASLWKVLFNSSTEKEKIPQSPEMKEVAEPDIPSKSLKVSRTVLHLQQTKQLLFDCARDMVETQGRKEKQREYLASDEVGKLVAEKVKLWGKKSNWRRHLESEFLDSKQEWSCYEKERREIAFRIGDDIFEEMKYEFAIDMMLDRYQN